MSHKTGPSFDTFAWPKLSAGESSPQWRGDGFQIGDKKVPVLIYHDSESGWSDDLVRLHADSGAEHAIQQASWRRACQSLSQLQSDEPTILEVGSNTGHFLNFLRQRMPQARIVGSDFLTSSLAGIHQRFPGIPLAQFDATKNPFPDATFDAVVMLNVLEHIEDDAAALQQTWRVLKPGGRLILEVPAGPYLYDYYDQHVMHFRRYSSRQVKKLLDAAGFETLRSSHLGFFIFPAFAAVKLWNRRHGLDLPDEKREKMVASQMDSTNGILLDKAMKLEEKVESKIALPFGVRCFFTALRPR